MKNLILPDYIKVLFSNKLLDILLKRQQQFFTIKIRNLLLIKTILYNLINDNLNKISTVLFFSLNAAYNCLLKLSVCISIGDYFVSHSQEKNTGTNTENTRYTHASLLHVMNRY